MKLKSLIIGALLLFFGTTGVLFLGGCATGASPQTTAENTIMSSMQALAVSGQVVIAYTALPQCGTPGATAICSNPSIVAQMKIAFNTAVNLLVAAQQQAQSGATVDMTAITSAITTLTNLTSSVKTQ